MHEEFAQYRSSPNLNPNSHKKESPKVFSYVYMKMLERRPHSYDRLMDKTSRGNVLSVRKEIVADLGSAERVLDIGCGTGEFAAMLASLGMQVDGFDNNPAMAEVARERVLTEHLENSVSVRCMGVGGMDTFADSYYDAVVSILVFSELSESGIWPGHYGQPAFQSKKKNAAMVTMDTAR